MPLTAGVRRTLGRTKGRPGVTSTIWRADAPHGVHASLDQEGEMRIGTQAPIGHQHIPCVQARMDRLYVGQVMGQQGCDDQLEEHPGARMEEPQEVRQGNAAPQPLLGRLAECLL
jgi:hypothetical protein